MDYRVKKKQSMILCNVKAGIFYAETQKNPFLFGIYLV